MTTAPAVIRAMLAELRPPLRLDAAHWTGSCIDGINTNGLAASAQLQPASGGTIRRYDTSAPAIEQLDFVSYLLAMYEDIPTIVADLSSGKMYPVVNPILEGIVKRLFTTTAVTLHFSIFDSQQRGLVIEFSGPNNLQWHTNDELRALANEPLFQDQVAYLNWWKATYATPTYTTAENSSFFNLPGAFNSSHRFIRAASLREPALAWKWPQDNTFSPVYMAAGVPSTNPTLVTAMMVQQTTWLPKGLDSMGGMQVDGGNTQREMTWWSVVRDHKSAMFYTRTANDPVWKRINLNTANWFTMVSRGGIQFTYPSPGVWWKEVPSA